MCLGFALGLFVNPPWGFAPEDNLAYRDYVALHQAADALVSTKYANARVLTAWPASDELTQPYLGYVKQPVRVLSTDDFSLAHMMAAADSRAQFDVALLFSTKYEPPRRLVGDWRAWDRIKTRFFGYHRDLPPEVAARLLGGEVVFEKHLGGQWVAVVDLQKAEEAVGSGQLSVVSGQWSVISGQWSVLPSQQGHSIVAVIQPQARRRAQQGRTRERLL